MPSFVVWLLSLVAKLYGYKFYSDINFTRSITELEAEGISVRASGFVVDARDPFGVYAVRYIPSIKENKYGRYN